jgi:GrpB-like predicted nucleotidyltransferase (UPF0157 family)
MVQYDGWRDYYEAEKRNIEDAVGELFLAMEHVGSTSVVGLVAKPVIDILAATQSLEDGPTIAASLEPLGYRQTPFIPHRPTLERLYFPKRSVNTPEGVDLEHPGYNIHVVPFDRFFSDEQLLFRDYLQSHPDLAAEYARLKCDIVSRISDYREYIPAKDPFIQRILADARAESR